MLSVNEVCALVDWLIEYEKSIYMYSINIQCELMLESMAEAMKKGANRKIRAEKTKAVVVAYAQSYRK